MIRTISFFYGEYYLLRKSYCERLNRMLKTKLNDGNYIEQILLTKWGRSKGYNEHLFNKEASINEEFIHLHKIIINRIEFADLLKYNNNEITVVHVKDGFDGEMRALDRQVELSIKLINDLRAGISEDYFRQLYVSSEKNKCGAKIADVFGSEDNFRAPLKTS